MRTNTTSWGKSFVLGIVISGVSAFSGHCVNAQITIDGTLPNNSIVNINGNTFNITGGTQAGSNLFHSFNEFSVRTGTEAHFNNTVDITNIITRVTGSSVSNIDGLIKVLQGNANLFLLNPNGIILGPNARLDIRGSFVASTANSIKFADGFEFSAKNAQSTPLLTISVPIGLQYGANPGRISVQGNGEDLRLTPDIIDTTVGLRVEPNQTLALVGGDVDLQGVTLKTAGGRIELGSVDGSSLVRLTPIDKGWALDYAGVSAFKDIQLSQGAAVDASGKGGGDIQVQGRRVTLTDGSQIEASTLGAEPGGTLLVRASEAVEVTGETADSRLTSGIGTLVYENATGTGGNLTIETRRLSVRNGGQITTATFGPGKAGNLTVNASELIELIGTTANGENASNLNTAVQQGATGAGGDLTVNTRQLRVLDGGAVSSATEGEGSAGNLTVNASEFAEVSGISKIGLKPSKVIAESTSFGIGKAGNIRIETGKLSIQDEAEVSVSGYGLGPAGNLTVTANDLRLNRGKITARTNAGVGAANITLQNLDLLLLQNQSQISAQAFNNANGGNINIFAPNGFVVAVPGQDNNIIASAEAGQGGKINITTTGIFGIEERRQTEGNITNDIDASSEFGLAGSVNINRPEVEPVTGLLELPISVVDVSGLVDTSCAAFANSETNKFIVTGRGGLPPSPNEPLSTDVVWSDTRLPKITAQRSQTVSTTPRSKKHPVKIAPATGWVFNGKGEVMLISHAPHANGLGSTSATCYQR